MGFNNLQMLNEQQQRARAEAFQSLHQQEGIFIVPNPWDAGSAKVLASLGFKALATTSAGLAFGLGKPDGHSSVSREQTLENASLILSACALPVSADLENGYGDAPGDCAETILLAAKAGLAGGSIEDATGKPQYNKKKNLISVESVITARAEAKNLPYPFTLTARAENLIYGRPDLPDTIKRLQAYADAGADVLFAPGLKTSEEVEAVVKAVAPRPVNVLMGISGTTLSIKMLEKLGVKRVSLGSSLARAAYGALFRAADEVVNNGTFDYANEAKPYADLNKLFS
jgi:2-methylisocitrate lyase-like PEP mutase family enzyme